MKQTSHFDIGLDFRMAGHTGIGTYLRGLVGGFKKNVRPDASKLALFAPGSHTAYGSGYSQIYFNAPIYSLWEQFQYPNRLKTCRLWHSPHYNIPYTTGKTKLVTTIHDIIHWKYRHQLNVLQRTYAECMLRRAVHHSDHIITVSEHTKRDLIENLSANPEKITVIYNGVDSDFKPMSRDELQIHEAKLAAKYRLPESFFLYVGLLKPHKNVARLIRSFITLKSQKKITSGLVVIGRGNPRAEDMRLIRDYASQINYLPTISNGELPLFYNLAKTLVHPSLYEGFGLTVLEAMACGTPVLTTRCASLPEVGGSAARYFKGDDEAELSRALLEMDSDPQIKSRMKDICLNQARRFSWEKSAFETAKIYETILA